MLETFGLHKGCKEYRRLIAAFERIFGATIFFGTDAFSGKAKVVQRSHFSFFSEAQSWYSRDPDQCPLSEEFENVIVLSDDFYSEITSHPIPADLEAVKVLAGAPAVLDLFMWLSYRHFVAKGRRRFRCWGRLAWRLRSAPSSMDDGGAFAKSWRPAGFYLRTLASAPRRSVRMA